MPIQPHIREHLNAYAAQAIHDDPRINTWTEWTPSGNNLYTAHAQCTINQQSVNDTHIVSCTPGRVYRLNVEPIGVRAHIIQQCAQWVSIPQNICSTKEILSLYHDIHQRTHTAITLIGHYSWKGCLYIFQKIHRITHAPTQPANIQHHPIITIIPKNNTIRNRANTPFITVHTPTETSITLMQDDTISVIHAP